MSRGGFCLFALLVATIIGISSVDANEQKYPLNFLVVGDWGRNGRYNQTLVATQMGRVGKALNVDFIISTGDNFYSRGLSSVNDPKFAKSFTEVYSAPSLQRPWYAVLGNHDYRGSVLAQIDKKLTERDSRWFCGRQFEISKPLDGEGGSVDFFFIDTNPFINAYCTPWTSWKYDWRGLGPTRAEHLDSQVKRLDTLLKNSTATWKIVIGHHPMYSDGPHGNTPELLERILPVMEAHGVDLYLNGHDHNLQHIKHSDKRTHFVTSGAGSQAWGGLYPTPGDGLQFGYDGQGFLSASVGPDSLQLRFYDAYGEKLYRTTLKTETS